MPAEVVADLDDHRDAFGIAGLGLGGPVGLGAEFPAVVVAQHENPDPVRTLVDMNLELGPGHRDEFGFGLAGLLM